MKLCIDCRHMNPGSGRSYEQCKAPQNIAGIDPVNGNVSMHWTYCESHRRNGLINAWLYHQCGRRARWFASKEAA